jgi:proline iminopeptidase
MPILSAYDGTTLSYHVSGSGAPVVCVPGGPMQSSAYLGDLGGLPNQLIMLDLRGTGSSGVPEDPASYRCDRLVDDVEALREHLGFDRMTLLSHSGGTNLAVLYATRYPRHIDRLVLISPSGFGVGITITGAMRRSVVLAREHEPWGPAAVAAFESVAAGTGTPADFAAMAPLWYARWDAETQAHQALGDQQRNNEAATIYGSDGAFDPSATRAALASFEPPVLLLAGEVDVNSPPAAVAELAGLIPNSTYTVQPGASHFPWLDDPVWFTKTVSAFLGTD